MTRFNLRNNGTVKAEGRAPPVLPVVVYNGERPWTAAGARAGSVAAPGTAPPEAAGWIGNEAWAYALLDERERADEGAGLMGSRLPPDNRMTTLIRLETSPVEARARLLVEAFERYPGEEEKGLREGYHVRVRSPGGRYGNEDLPPFEEMERELRARRGGKEMATLMEARTREFEERAVARGRAEGERMLLRRLTERRFGRRDGGAAFRPSDVGQPHINLLCYQYVSEIAKIQSNSTTATSGSVWRLSLPICRFSC